jgi:hypothetical protein
MEFLSCCVHSSFLEQGVTCHSSYTLQRCVTFPIRDQGFAAQPGILSRPHSSLVWGPVDDPSQSLPFSATPHAHPFVRPGPRPCRITLLNSQSLIDNKYRGKLWGPTHVQVPNVGTLPPASCPLTCEREKIQLTSLSHSKPHG